MANITIKKLEKSKKAIDEGKPLAEIAKAEKVNIKELNESLIRRYGTEQVGNPLKKNVLLIRARRLMEQAKVELSKSQVLEVLETLKTEV